jgi:AcrR family transcriptional regulator
MGSPAESRRSNTPTLVAKEKLVDATIDILRTSPFAEVTTRRIAEAAGIDRSTITRQFGGLAGLFNEVCNELSIRARGRMGPSPDLANILDPDLVLQTRLTAWLITSGADVTKLDGQGVRGAREVMTQRQRDLAGVSERTAFIMNEIVALASQSFILFSETRRFAPEDITDAVDLIRELRKLLPVAEAQLGWRDTPSATLHP